MTFTAVLFRDPGPGSWTFAEVPDEHAPQGTGPWGRIAVRATLDGKTWDTSVWKGKDGRCLLSVPKRIRRGKEPGESVTIAIAERS